MARPKKVVKEASENRADITITVAYNGKTVKTEFEINGLTGNLLKNQRTPEYILSKIIYGSKM
jgi:hypothetical protein